MDKLEQNVQLRQLLENSRSQPQVVAENAAEFNADFVNFSERIKKLLFDAKDHIQNARTELSSKTTV